MVVAKTAMTVVTTAVAMATMAVAIRRPPMSHQRIIFMGQI